MALTRLGTNAITSVPSSAISGTLPAANINDTSISNITALPAGVGGKVLQVVEIGIADYGQSNSSITTWVDVKKNTSAMILSLTPSSTSSKILVNCVLDCSVNGNATQKRMEVRLMGDINGAGYNTLTGSYYEGLYYTSSGSLEPSWNSPLSVLWSPNTTSQCNLKLQFKGLFWSDTNVCYINQDGTSTTRIVAMEIGA
jgi:hypothetical protein